jgi:mRNA interferase YafQ
MTYQVKWSSRFKKEYKKAKKRYRDEIALLHTVVDLLRQGISLPAKYKDHALTGDYAGCRECHIKPNWLLVYLIEDDVLVLTLTRTGSHSDLFG